MAGSFQQAREALGARLREIRKDADLTGRALAASLGWHFTKVSKLEHGARSPSEPDIRVWCRACRADEQIPDLIATVRAIESMYVEWRRQLRAGMRRSLAARSPLYERTKLFRLYEPGLVPGLFQTAEYARAVIATFLEFSGAATDLDDAVAARMEWQKIIYGDRRFLVVLEEQALLTFVGSADIMTGQLDRLLAVMSLRRLDFGIIPCKATRRVMPSAGFAIFDDELVQVETVSAELTVTQPREISLYAKRFELLQQSAAHGRDARALITRAIHELPAEPE